jgi:TolA-binding protein
MARTHPLVRIGLLAALCCGPAPLASATAATVARADEGDEQYQYLAGLCEKSLWDLAAREGRAFLERHPRHARAQLARYRLATALFELDRRDEAAAEYERLASVPQFEFAAESAFRLGQCRLASDQAAGAAAAFQRTRELARADESRAYLARPAAFFHGEALFRAERFDEAEAAYRDALAGAQADDAYVRESRYGLVWCAARAGRHAEVVQLAERYRAQWADDAEAAESLAEVDFLRAEALAAAGETRAALSAYGAIEDGALGDGALRGAAFALVALGEHAQAAERFERLLARHPDSRHAGEAALQAGIAHLRAGDAAAARRALEDVRVARGPESDYWLARAQREGGDAEAALATLERALGARPDAELAARLQSERGDALADLGRGDEAARAWRSAGGDYGLYAAAVAALNAGRSADALAGAEELLRAHPDSQYADDARLAAGEAALALGEHARAEAHFERLASGTGALRLRGASRAAWCRYLAGDAAEAERRFAGLAAEAGAAPEAEEALYMAGRAAEEAGDAQAAARHWTQWLARHDGAPRTSEVRLGLARVIGPEQALEHLTAAAREAPSGPAREEALFRLGEQLAATGERDGAARAHQRLLEESPDSAFAPAAGYALAWLQHEQGDHAAARAQLERLFARGELEGELALAARELGVWIEAALGDPAAAGRAWDAFERVCRDDARRLAALEVVLAACRKAGARSEAAPRIERFLASTRDRALAARALVEATWLALDAGDAETAEAAVRAALRVAPAEARAGAGGQSLAEAVFFVGEARWSAGERERAGELYGLAQGAAQGELAARVAYKQGFAALERGDAAAAEAAFERLLAEHPQSPLAGECLALLGESRLARGDAAGAIEPLTRLIEEQPRHASVPRALLRLGVAQGELEAWPACESALREFLRRAPDDPQAALAELWRARALARRGEGRAARAGLERVVERDKGALGAQARLELGALLEASGDLDGALAEYLKVGVLYADGPSVAEALFRAGRCLEAQDQPAAARERYREVLADHPREAAAPRARERLDALETGSTDRTEDTP